MKKCLFILLCLAIFNCFAEAQDCEISKEKQNCDKCTVDDDEYCVYNECYADRKYRLMKEELCLTSKQEAYIDNIYKIYKIDMEALCSKYKDKKNKILEMIDCDNPCWKDEIKHLKEIKNDTKERYNCFRDDVKELLSKRQCADFSDFEKCQKKKLKKIIKYGAVYKLPCAVCTSKK